MSPLLDVAPNATVQIGDDPLTRVTLLVTTTDGQVRIAVDAPHGAPIIQGDAYAVEHPRVRVRRDSAFYWSPLGADRPDTRDIFRALLDEWPTLNPPTVCASVAPHGLYRCSRPAGHPLRHVAAGESMVLGDIPKVLCAWPFGHAPTLADLGGAA